MLINRSKHSLIQEIQARKEAICCAVNAASGDLRRQFVTESFGQEIVYQDQAEEAEQYLTASSCGMPYSTEAFPYIAAGIGIDGDTPKEVADTYLRRRSETKRAFAEIESTRKSTLLRVNSVETLEDVLQLEQEFLL